MLLEISGTVSYIDDETEFVFHHDLVVKMMWEYLKLPASKLYMNSNI